MNNLHKTLEEILNKTYKTIDTVPKEVLQFANELNNTIFNDKNSLNLFHTLKGQSELYKLITENLSDIIWTSDLDLNFDYFSPSTEAILGYTQEEMLSININDVLTPQSLDHALQVLSTEINNLNQQTPDKYRTKTIELLAYHKNQSVITLEVIVKFLRDKDYKPIGILGITRDITKKKIAEEHIRQSEEKYRTIFESIDDGYYEVDLDGTFTFINNSLCSILGYSKEEVIGNHFKDFMDEENLKQLSETFRNVFNSRESTTIVPTLFHKKDNTNVRCEGSITIIYSSENKIIGFCGTLRDVSNRIKKEEELIKSERRWKSLFESLPCGSFIVDADKKITNVNPVVCELTGFSAEELIGKSCSLLCEHQNDNCPISDNTDNFETSLLTKSGDKISILKTAKIIEEDDDNYILENFLDITELKKIEEALRKRNKTIEEDLKAAHFIQRALIPDSQPQFKGLKIDYRYLPLDAVGGDYFSFKELKNGGFGTFIGDVSSHGVTAALFLSLIKATTDRIFNDYSESPIDYIQALNNELFGYMPLSFLTALYGVIKDDPEKGMTFTYSAAGHPYPIIYRAETGIPEILFCKGTLIGIFDDIVIDEEVVELKKGDRIFLYTDGIPETMNANKKIWGFRKLPELITKANDTSLSITLDRIMEELNRFRGETPLSDDIVLIGIEIQR